MRIRRVLASLYVQVLIGIAAGVVLGFVAPSTGAAMRPLGDGFIKLVKMLIAPIVFSHGRRRHRADGRDEARSAGSACGRCSTSRWSRRSRWCIGLVVVQRPAARAPASPSTRRSLDMSAVASLHHGVEAAAHGRFPPEHHSRRPSSMRSREATSCRCCSFSVLFGLAAAVGSDRRVAPLVVARSMRSARRSFAIVGIIMRLAPVGAFGAMAFTVGRYGVGALVSLGKLMAGMYITCLLFVFVVLGAIARAIGFSIVRVPRATSARRS